MGIYVVEFGVYSYYTAAKNEDEAIQNIYKRENVFLPFRAQKIVVPGYVITLKKEV